MTSAPVKDVSSLMNYVNTRELTVMGNMSPTGSFGDVMSKASGGGQDLKQNSQVPAPREAGRTQVRDTSPGRRDVVRTEETTTPNQNTAEDMDATVQETEKAGKELIGKIADQLDVSEEEVVEAMEELGMSFYSLFDPASLTELVIALSGEQDSLSLLTDEGLFADLQQLLQTVQSIKDGLMQQLNMDPEEMQTLLEQLETEGVQPTDQSLVETETLEAEAPDEKPSLEGKITIEVKRGGETVTMAADENGNTTGKVLEVQDQTKAPTEHMDQKEGGSKGKGENQQEALHTGNPILDEALQNRTQSSEVSFEQTQPFAGQDTQEIMDQILNYMRIQLRPGMDQLEMQLHPASLGTVHVQITSRGGEVTALFHVQNEAVKAAMEGQMSELKESLKDQGLKVEAVEVNVESHGFESNLWQGQGREENASAGNGSKKAPRRINLNDLDESFEEEAEPEDVLAAKMMEANGNTVDFTA